MPNCLKNRVGVTEILVDIIGERDKEGVGENTRVGWEKAMTALLRGNVSAIKVNEMTVLT